MSRFGRSRRAAILRFTCVVASIAVVASAVLAVRSGDELAFFATMAAVLVAAASGVQAYWADVSARRSRGR